MDGTFLGCRRLVGRTASFVFRDTSIVFEGKQGEPRPVVEIAAAQSRDEEGHGAGHEDQADEHQDHDDVHVVRLSRSRQAVSATTPTELVGIRIAAITGVTSPASASERAIRL